MTQQSSDSFVDLEFNGDRTQVFATIHPPRGAGKELTVEEIVGKLRQIGVMYGFREGDIARGIAQVASSSAPATRILAAQGVLPVEGQDAKMLWSVDEAAVSQSIPTCSFGCPDYFQIPKSRIVVAGQTIASVKPASPGSAGKTLTAPYKVIPVSAPREVPFAAGRGIKYVADKHEFVAELGGILEVKGTTIFVHAIQWIEGNLNNVTKEFSTGIVVSGDITASVIRAAGPIAVQGTTAGASIRAKGDCVLGRCARTKIIADGDVYVRSKLLHASVVTPQRLVGLPGSQIAGGCLQAMLGIEADEVGATDGTPTDLVTAVDGFTAYRQQEVDCEIAAYEDNLQKIGSVLRPLTVGNHDALPDKKRLLIQTLMAQRRGLEERIRQLHNEKRSLIFTSKSRVDAEIKVRGTIYRGVNLKIEGAAICISQSAKSVKFALNVFRDAVTCISCEEELAA